MPTDESLVGQVAAGDEAALRALMRRWERPLAHVIHRHTGGRDVEDLYQETWWRVVRGAPQFDAQRRFSTWLFQIAINCCRDWYRRRPPDGIAAGEPSAPPDGRADAALDVAGLLRRLAEPQREVVVLRYLRGMNEEEMASVLGIPRGTVKSRLHHALAQLNALALERGAR
jgi:RNA polymerase sigma-70 factor (ECF subfamily)